MKMNSLAAKDAKRVTIKILGPRRQPQVRASMHTRRESILTICFNYFFSRFRSDEGKGQGS